MYHCHLHFYLTGHPCRAFEAVRAMPPLEHFTHKFWESAAIDGNLAAKADIILANMQGMDAAEALQALASNKRGDAPLIVLADRGQTDIFPEHLPGIFDIWVLPMDEWEIRFRFLKLQRTYKVGVDLWQSEQYLEAAINSTPNLVWYKDKEGLHEKVNDSFCRTVNKTKAQVEGRDHFYIWDVDPDDPENAGNDCSVSETEVMAKKQTCMYEENVKTGDGMKLFTTYKSPLYDFDGSVMGTVGIGIDITQERVYEKEIVDKNKTLEAIFMTLDCGVLCHTVDGSRILSVNDAALHILGYESKEEMMETGFSTVARSVFDADKPKLRKSICGLTKEGDSTSVEYRVLHKDGQLLHVMCNIKLVKENGRLFYQRLLLDCTAQKLKEEENSRHQAELIQALSMDYNLVCLFNLDTGIGHHLRSGDDSGHMFMANPDGEISFDESMESYIKAHVYEKDQEMMYRIASREKLKEELAEKQIYYVNYRAIQDDEMKYHEMKVVRAGTWGDNPSIVLGFRSVDEETKRELERKRLLEDALMQANRANKAKSVFLSNMSHDIRTPMNAITGFTTLAIAHIDDKKAVEEYLGKIMVSGSHLLDLINDILDMSRIESGKVQLEKAPCSLGDILNGLKNIVQADANRKKLKMDIDMSAVSNPDICCDRLRLNQVLLNIFSNSVKYTNEGGAVSLTVTQKGKAAPGYANYEFCIEDNGIGMSKEFTDRMFDPFEREKNSTISGIQGTGLGLAITKNIVDLMDGSIEVESALGKGTKVTLTFGFEQVDEEKAQKMQKPQNETFRVGSSCIRDVSRLLHRGGFVEESDFRQGGNRRILLVEDNELNQEIATAILEDAGFEVEVAGNGQVAVDMLRNSELDYYQLVLMDIQMPVMDGYEATRVIRSFEEEELASIPILAMTANAFEGDRKEAMRCGMNGHVAKPIEVDKLFEALYALLR